MWQGGVATGIVWVVSVVSAGKFGCELIEKNIRELDIGHLFHHYTLNDSQWVTSIDCPVFRRYIKKSSPTPQCLRGNRVTRCIEVLPITLRSTMDTGTVAKPWKEKLLKFLYFLIYPLYIKTL
ncbi:hypothetical protein TNCV_739661 [Trichonephila clavipes]|nr:hypothetical protein TNCV_739661 [Trichonephila clavipes]